MKSLFKYIKKTEAKSIKKQLKSLKNTHDKFFSKKRYISFLFYNFFYNLLSYLFVLIVFLIILFVINFIFGMLFKDVDQNNIHNVAIVLLSLSATFVVGLPLAIVITLGSSNEYFNIKEFRLFFDITSFKFLSNFTITIEAVAYLVVGIICVCLSRHLEASLYFLVAILFSLYSLVRYIIYMSKNKYDRFYYFIKHSYYYRVNTKKDTIKDYLTIISFCDKNGAINIDAITRLVILRFRHVFHFMDDIKQIMTRDENIIKEQNILENYFIQYSKNIETPIQLMSFSLALEQYVSYILSDKSYKLIKDFAKTKEIVKKSLDCAIFENKIEICRLAIPLERLSGNALFFPDFKKIVLDNSQDIILAQACVIMLFEQLIDKINKRKKELCIETDAYSIWLKDIKAINNKNKNALNDCYETIKNVTNILEKFISDSNLNIK